VFGLTTVVTVELTSVTAPVPVATWDDPRWGADMVYEDGCNILGWRIGYPDYDVDNLVAEIVLLETSESDVLGSTQLIAQSVFVRGPGQVFPINLGEKTTVSFNKLPGVTYGLRLSLLPDWRLNPTTPDLPDDGVYEHDRIYNLDCEKMTPGEIYDTLFIRCGSWEKDGSGYVSGCSPSNTYESRKYFAITRNCSVPEGSYVKRDGDPNYPYRFCIPLGIIE